MEEVGNEYFLTLESRSLFQKSSDDKSCFLMHDLVSDLAKSISGQFISRLEDGCSQEIVNNTRHLSYCFKQDFHSLKKFETLHKAKRLRAFIHLDMSRYNWPHYRLSKKVVHDLLPTRRCLRLLSLSNYVSITELPESIGKLKHLRYLDISYTQVQRLPDSICQLCNLQALRLSNCEKLVVLPRDMWKLISLRHLDITKTGIKEMPIHLGRLKCLQTLTKFIVGKSSGTCIGELGNFTNLQGSLSILQLQNVKSPTDALNASLRDKKYLKEFVLEWNVNSDFLEESQRSVLDSLQPHTSLKSLTIRHYGGKSFSDWVGHPSFANVASIELHNCEYCNNLPPLGQLHSLQKLYVVGFNEVVTVGREFFGSGSSSSKPFGALKVLKFENMKKWGEWNYFGDENEGVGFPKLEELYIIDCPKLTGWLPVHLPSLARLVICNCQQLMAPLPRTPAIHNLSLDDCNGVLLNEGPRGMQKLGIGGFDALELLPKGMIDSNGGLQELVIRRCSSLVSLPKDGLPSTLKALLIDGCRKLELPTNLDYSSLGKLSLWDCDSVKSFPLDLFPNLYHIEIGGCINLESLTVPENYEHDLVALMIYISFCRNFVFFPKGGLRAPSLTRFRVSECGSLRSLPDKMHVLLPSLEYLGISSCPKVESFPEGGLPSNLKSIDIRSCDKLIASRMGWGLQNLPFLRSFSIGSDSEDVESFPEEQLLPTSLTYLDIMRFPNLKSLDKRGLQHLNALEKLSIGNCPELKYMPEQGLPPSLSFLQIDSCPKLKYMPEQGLPPSLSTLQISGCPLLKKKLQSKKGKEWRKVAHVEKIRIDYNLIE